MTPTKWLPVHLHMLPVGVRELPMAGVVVAVETNPSLFAEYYDRSRWIGEDVSQEVDRVVDFLDRWDTFAWQDISLLGQAWFTLEHDVEGLLGRLRSFRRKGLASVQLFHWAANTYFSPTVGLTEVGRKLLWEMADCEVLLDLTHVPVSAIPHVLNASPARKILSHVVCEDVLDRSLVRRSNALPPDVLEACDAELYAIPFIDDLVSPRAVEHPTDRGATTEVIAQHLIRMSEIVGVERVALGPDYFSPSVVRENLGFDVETVPGMDTAEGLMALAAVLGNAGWNLDNLEAVYWRNAFRVFEQFPGRCVG